MKHSLVILTCNRKDSAIALLKSIDAQYKKPDEIIVVDNASDDGTSEHINANFKDVKLVSLKKNLGASGRNEGIKIASGDIIITLDDDVFFADPYGIYYIDRIFHKNSNVSVINFQILDGETKKLISFNWFHPYQMDKYSQSIFKTDYISEGAVCFRKKVFDNVGYYPDEFFISHEGPDLAYRIIDAGFHIHYYPVIKVLHKCSTQHRVSWRNTYYDTRNQIWLAVRNLPFLRAVMHIIYRMITTFLFSIKRKQLKWYIKAVIDGVKGIKHEMNFRKPISQKTIRKIREIRKNKPGIIQHLLSFNERTNSINKKFER